MSESDGVQLKILVNVSHIQHTMTSSIEGGLSVIIITKNEIIDIADCLASIKDWVDEIIVFDSGSSDGTVQYCRAMGARVFETDWPGFGAQKNRALEKASGSWVLSLDADERVSAALREEIIATLTNSPQNTAYSMPRNSSFCGRFMNHSGWWPDYVVRLFKRQEAEFLNVPVHERIITKGSIGTLVQALTHLSIRDLHESLEKINQYSSAGAKALFSKGQRGSLTSAVVHSIWTFMRHYIFRCGFLDGREGFLLAVANAEGCYYRYVKLMMMYSDDKS